MRERIANAASLEEKRMLAAWVDNCEDAWQGLRLNVKGVYLGEKSWPCEICTVLAPSPAIYT